VKPLLLEQGALGGLVRGVVASAHPSRGIHDPVPGERAVPAKCVERVSHLPRVPPHSCEFGDLPVGGHSSSRDARHHVIDASASLRGHSRRLARISGGIWRARGGPGFSADRRVPSSGRRPARWRATLTPEVKRSEKARRIEDILQRLHAEALTPLDHEDAYTLLVSVLLSAQCTDARVNLVTPGLFAVARTPEAMAQVPVREIQRCIRSCGLAPSKARNIKALSQMLVARHGGRVPDDFDALEALPGVGHKTASVVIAQAFGKPAFPVDTHIHRLAGRWGLSRARNVVEVERDLKRLFAPEDWGKIHLQIILFGRSHCPARGHDFAACPICSWAASRARIAREGRGTSKGSPVS